MTVLLGALIAIAPLAMDIYLASMPSMTQALSATSAQVQLTLSLYMYAWGVGQLMVGPLSDRFGRRPVLVVGLGIFVLASAVCAAAPNVETLIGARIVQGMSLASAAVVPRAIVRDLYAAERAAHMLSLMGLVLGIAPIVAPIIGSHVHVWLGWQANFAFVAVYGVLALVYVARRLPETLRARNPRATDVRTLLHNYGRLLRSRHFVGYMMVASFSSCGLFSFLAGSAFVFVSVLGKTEQTFSFLFASVMFGNVAGATVASRVIRQWGIDRMIARASALMVVAGLSLAGFAWAGIAAPLAVVVPMFFFMMSFMMTMPQATAGGLTPFPDIAGSASSLLSFAQFIMASTAALLVGVFYDGTVRPMATAIGLAGTGVFLSFRLVVRRS